MPSMWWRWVKRFHPPTLRRACASGTSCCLFSAESTVAIRFRLPYSFLVSLFPPSDVESYVSWFTFPCYSVERQKYSIQIPLPPKIDPSVTMMTVEEKPDVTYADLGGVTEQIEKIREVVELPLLQVQSQSVVVYVVTPFILHLGPPGLN